MVATPTVRGARAAAATFVLLLLSSALPVANAQSLPPVTGGGNVSIEQGEAMFFQSNLGGGRIPTSFITSETSTSKLNATIYNAGTARTVPVYFWFSDPSMINAQGYSVRSKCNAVSVPAASQDVGTSVTLASVNTTWEFESKDLPPGAYNVSIQVGSRPSQIQNSCAGDLGNVDADNNKANAYFVKDQKIDLRIREIRWCRGAASSATCDETMTAVGSSSPGSYNLSQRASQTTTSKNTFFEVVTENVGGWANLSDYGGACGCDGDGFPYTLNVSIKGAFINGATNVTSTTAEANAPGRSRSWSILNHAGDYNVTVRIDPDARLRSSPTETGHKTVNIGYRDFVSEIRASDLKTSATDPYDFDEPVTVRGNVTFRNLGRQAFQNAVEAETMSDLKWRVYIYNDSRPGDQEPRFVESGHNASIDGHGAWTVSFEWVVSPSPTQDNYLSPGRHTIRAEVDSVEGKNPPDTGNTFNAGWNVTWELDDFNNNASIDIFFADASAPTFLTDKPKITAAPNGVNDATAAELRPHQLLNLFANVTDDDELNLRVQANFSLTDKPEVYRTYPMDRVLGASSRFAVQLANFTFAENQTGENWSVRVTATDLFDNNVTSGTTKFRLVPWEIHNASREYLVVDAPDAKNISWGSDEHPSWTIRVMPNATGYSGQQFNVSNMRLELVTPKNRTYVANWTSLSDCPLVGNELLGERRPVCVEQTNNTFRTAFLKTADDGGPGKWNYSIQINDLANITRYVNSSFLIVDKLPEIRETFLLPGTVDPGQNFTVKANFTDDFSVKSANVSFTRTVPNDGLVVNLSLPLTIAQGTGTSFYVANSTFGAGRGKDFGTGGTFNATIWVIDENDNVNSTSLGAFTLNDTDVPTLVDGGAVPAVQELGQNVTFYAHARDSTNVSVKLQVLRLSEEVFPAVYLTEGADGNYTYTTNFSTEASYDWILTAIDSTGRASDIKRGSITIRDNLGPKFEVRSPSYVFDGQRYGGATPRIELLVHDTEGVLPNTVEMKVGGLAVSPDIVPATGSQGGYVVSYTVPATKKFSHKDVVEVNVTAIDNSTEKLRSDLNFTFVVDDVAPVARIVGISPSYRDQPSQPLNISLASRITLAAEDNDGVPTEADAIRFRILGGGNNAAETVYSGPFRITDAPGVYTGPRLYQIQFWAEDSVGNFNRNFNVTTVYVDDTPPALFQFFPQGRSINATFVDDRVGVNRSVAWYRINNDPYVPLPLVEDAGTWSITLPEGRKGDRLSYYLQAWDRLDNTDTFGNASAPYASFDVSNHEPFVKIKTPTEGSRLGRTVELTWDASDEDRDALVFTIYYKAPGKTAFTELVRLENTDVRRYAIDTLRLADGQYTLRVAASDGAFVKLSDVTVTIINRGSAVGTVEVVGGALPGDTALVTAQITKSQAQVEARIYLDGDLVDAFPMNDEGENGDVAAGDGIYSARVPIDDAGDYSVEIFSRYQEDGELKESTVADAATFSAKLTPGYILSEYAVILGLIALLALAGIGIAVFVVVRRK